MSALPQRLLVNRPTAALPASLPPAFPALSRLVCGDLLIKERRQGSARRMLACRETSRLCAADPQALGRLGPTLALQGQQALQAHARSLQGRQQPVEAELDRDGGVGGLDGRQVDCACESGGGWAPCGWVSWASLGCLPACSSPCLLLPPICRTPSIQTHLRSPAPPACRSANGRGHTGRRCSARQRARRGRRPP